MRKNQDERKSAGRGTATLADETVASVVLLGVRATEKAYVRNTLGQYVFTVSRNATKPQIRRAVESAYDVTVLSVNTGRLPGKKRGSVGRRGSTKAVKKAVVTLSKGSSLELFKGI